MTQPEFSTKLAAAILLSVFVATTGCSSMMGRSNRSAVDNIDLDSLKAAGYTMGATGVNLPMPASDKGEPCVYLEVVNKKRHLEKIPMPVEQPMFIGDVIREAKLTERIGRINVEVVRPTGANQPPIRLTVDFDSDGKRVMEGQNYSLRPGDRIVVTRNTESSFDRFMAKVMPFAASR